MKFTILNSNSFNLEIILLLNSITLKLL